MTVVVVYVNGAEVKRWEDYAAQSLPGHLAYEIGAYLRWAGATTSWWRNCKHRRGWVSASPAEVPKVYRLLTLLE